MPLYARLAIHTNLGGQAGIERPALPTSAILRQLYIAICPNCIPHTTRGRHLRIRTDQPPQQASEVASVSRRGLHPNKHRPVSTLPFHLRLLRRGLCDQLHPTRHHQNIPQCFAKTHQPSINHLHRHLQANHHDLVSSRGNRSLLWRSLPRSQNVKQGKDQ